MEEDGRRGRVDVEGGWTRYAGEDDCPLVWRLLLLLLCRGELDVLGPRVRDDVEELDRGDVLMAYPRMPVLIRNSLEP